MGGAAVTGMVKASARLGRTLKVPSCRSGAKNAPQPIATRVVCSKSVYRGKNKLPDCSLHIHMFLSICKQFANAVQVLGSPYSTELTFKCLL